MKYLKNIVGDKIRLKPWELKSHSEAQVDGIRFWEMTLSYMIQRYDKKNQLFCLPATMTLFTADLPLHKLLQLEHT